MYLASLRPGERASYYAVLFVIIKDRPRKTSTTRPSSFPIMTLESFPFEFEDPSTKGPSNFLLFSTGEIILATKLVSTCFKCFPRFKLDVELRQFK
jgi:hypothetical protein